MSCFHAVLDKRCEENLSLFQNPACTTIATSTSYANECGGKSVRCHCSLHPKVHQGPGETGCERSMGHLDEGIGIAVGDPVLQAGKAGPIVLGKVELLQVPHDHTWITPTPVAPQGVM